MTPDPPGPRIREHGFIAWLLYHLHLDGCIQDAYDRGWVDAYQIPDVMKEPLSSSEVSEMLGSGERDT